jgi:hypothetical protein
LEFHKDARARYGVLKVRVVRLERLAVAGVHARPERIERECRPRTTTSNTT